MAPCSKRDVGGGLCKQHGGAPRCRIPGCERTDILSGYCPSHYRAPVALAAASAVSEGDAVNHALHLEAAAMPTGCSFSQPDVPIGGETDAAQGTCLRLESRIDAGESLLPFAYV